MAVGSGVAGAARAAPIPRGALDFEMGGGVRREVPNVAVAAEARQF